MSRDRKFSGEGVRARHSRSCGFPATGCTCEPSWEAFVYDALAERKIRKTFRERHAAESWRTQMLASGSSAAAEAMTALTAASAALNGHIGECLDEDREDEAQQAMEALGDIYAALDVVARIAYAEVRRA